MQLNKRAFQLFTLSFVKRSFGLFLRPIFKYPIL